jgi:predicted house-cleaning noncanonical NTP pyrophosphatase (MazG superfamily)
MADTEPDAPERAALGAALAGPYGHGKLVRDKIPEIIRSQGPEPVTYTAGTGEYRIRLRDKLREEVQEYLNSGDPGELADILEVLYTLAGQAGVSRAQLEELRAAKAEERGGFAGRVIWSGNQPAASTEPDQDVTPALGAALAAGQCGAVRSVGYWTLTCVSGKDHGGDWHEARVTDHREVEAGDMLHITDSRETIRWKTADHIREVTRLLMAARDQGPR